MATKRFCDICGKEIENEIRVGWKWMYCKKCWLNENNWRAIHENAVPFKTNGGDEE